MCLFVRFMAVSFQGPQRIDAARRFTDEGGDTALPFPRPVLFSLRSGMGKVSHNNKLNEV